MITNEVYKIKVNLKKKNSKLGLAVNLINLTLTYPIVTAKAASHNL